MSERNVELTRHVIEASNARDIEAIVACCDPSIEVHSAVEAVGGGVYHGHAGIQKLFADLAEVLREGVRLEPLAYFDLGEHTLCFIAAHGRGRHSGVEGEMPLAQVVRWRDGLAVYSKAYARREDALRESGVSEDELDRAVRTSANVELVRSIYADWERGETSALASGRMTRSSS